MTVAELIKALADIPPDLPVLAWDGDFQQCVDLTLIDVANGEVCLYTGAKRVAVKRSFDPARPSDQ